MKTMSKCKDTDGLILQKMDHKTLYSICLVNKYMNRICDKYFWMNKFINEFGGINGINTAQKDSKQTWKNYYINIIKKLKGNMNDLLFESSKKGRLDLVKIALQNGADIYASNDWAVQLASHNGRLEVVKYLVENGAHIHADDDWAVRIASKYGELEVVKYLVENDADIHADDDYALRWASSNGKLEVVKYLKSLP